MSRSYVLVAGSCLLAFASGCATGKGSWRETPRTTCALIGGVIGAGIGAGVSNPNHTEDDDQDMAIGAGVGGAAGAALGALLCGQKVAAAPPPPPPPRAMERPPAPIARRIVLRGVNFAFDSSAITPESEAILDAAVEVLKENRSVQVEVAGHTDHTGPDAYNQGLSERRAKSVYRYLASHGIDADRLTTIGYGESHPVADNSSRDGRAQNRRVELNIRE